MCAHIPNYTKWWVYSDMVHAITSTLSQMEMTHNPYGENLLQWEWDNIKDLVNFYESSTLIIFIFWVQTITKPRLKYFQPIWTEQFPVHYHIYMAFILQEQDKGSQTLIIAIIYHLTAIKQTFNNKTMHFQMPTNL